MLRTTTFLPCVVCLLLLFGTIGIHCFPRASEGNEERENLVHFLRSLNLELPLENDDVRDPQSDTQKRQITSDQKKYLDAHNAARSNVNPSAANMKKMKWSDDLAVVAQNYANKCIWGHNSARTTETKVLTSEFSYVGENLYATSSSTVDPTYAVENWDSEKKDYTYSSNTCSDVCGHYTQVVWANSEYLGCASKTCTSISGLPSSYTGGTIVVCNYGNGGNRRGVKPYVSGASCSSCPGGYTCSGNLCVNGSDTSSGSGSGGSTTTDPGNENIPDKDCYTGDGSSYSGTVSKTASGKTCLTWSNVYPFLPNNNHCRNYFAQYGITEPVCYMQAGTYYVESCGIPKCV